MKLIWSEDIAHYPLEDLSGILKLGSGSSHCSSHRWHLTHLRFIEIS